VNIASAAGGRDVVQAPPAKGSVKSRFGRVEVFHFIKMFVPRDGFGIVKAKRGQGLRFPESGSGFWVQGFGYKVQGFGV